MPSALAGELILQHQRAFAGRRIDAIDVRGRALVVGDVSARVAADRPTAVRLDIEVAHGLSASFTNLRR